MKNPRILFVSIIALFALMIPVLTVNAQFITIARKIKSMHTPQTDIATVMVEAGTAGVYRTVIDTLSSNKTFAITSRNDTKRYVEFTKKGTSFSMQIDSLAKNLSQITVACPKPPDEETSATQPAVQAILRVCKILGVQGTIEKP